MYYCVYILNVYSVHIIVMHLTIDVGLINLAMCVMDSDSKNLDTFHIHLWRLFNIFGETGDYKCESLLKNGKICNKNCKYKYKGVDKSIIYCCKTHFPKDIEMKKGNIYKKKLIKSYLLQDIAIRVIETINEIYKTNAELFIKLTNIVIELQPKICPKMKFTSHLIYGKLTEIMTQINPKCTIRFVRASEKLKAYTGLPIVCNLKNAYARRKFLSVSYCQWFLENKFSKTQEKWLIYFQSNKIKADLADCFLMSINSIIGIPKKQMLQKNGGCIK